MVDGLGTKVLFLEILQPSPNLGRRDGVPRRVLTNEGHKSAQPLGIVDAV